ncbi:hypothetical protein K1T71_012143 [Dendrolimus kikuchii]|uniref:Uncharacterized protein n=1 Tax=Dendrolimus kikuchii TaxID=765133 RepID=A0ACC1CKR8_9NEOP|nr:hypothetical protein K1T71_012143 [Dendrolimus kikuchii]
MALTFKPNKLCRFTYNICRRYSDENKSYYQIHEEGPKPREVYGQPYPEWRKPWIRRQGEWTSKLSVFVEKNPSPDIMYTLSKIPDMNWQTVKDWWSDMKEIQEIVNQKYLPERVAMLGSNLAAMHFFTYRQAYVRLKDSSEWLGGDITKLNFPDHYEDGYFVEAVDCTNFHHNGIRYEGLQNLMNLNFLKWLSLKNNKHIDVWCMDRIAGQNGKSLEYLDISGCKLCVGSIFAIARMSALKYLIITDPGDDMNVQTALSMLEQERPNLLIKAEDRIIEDTGNIKK